MENIAERIRQCPALEGLSNAQLVALISRSRELTARPDQELFREGDAPVAMYFLLQGKVEIRGRQGVLSSVPQNGIFGEMGVVSRVPRSASAVAKTVATVLALPREAFYELLEQDKDFAFQFYRNLVNVLVHKLQKNNEVLEFTQLLTE